MKDDELPIIRAWYEFVLWLVPKIGKFPRDQRFTLGKRIEGRVYDVLEGLIRARYSPRRRRELLEQVNVSLEVLRFEMRIAHDLHSLPTKAYGQAADRLADVGRQVGGWMKLAVQHARE